MNYRDMIEGERAAYERAPMGELRTIRVALAVHSWGNTLQEKARAEAVEQIIHARLSARMKARAETPYGEELCRNGVALADCDCC
jgi:hypothetical protein